MDKIRELAGRVDERLRQSSPYALLSLGALGALSYVAAGRICDSLQKRSLREVVGDYILLVPSVRAEYVKQVQEVIEHKKETVRKNWSVFPDPIVVMPTEGLSGDTVRKLIDTLAEATNKPLETRHISGAIYSPSILPPSKAENKGTETDAGTKPTQQKGDKATKASTAVQPSGARKLATVEDLTALAADLQELYVYGFRKAYLWNPLHGTEFAVGDYLSYQVVNMVADMFGADPARVSGLVTSGGTESLMTALRCYANWGIKNKGLARGEGVVICPDTIHAAVMKGGMTYDLRIVLVPTLAGGRVDLKAFRRTLSQHASRAVCIIGSAPSFPTGVVDPLQEMGAMAREYGVGFHIDACLGGFIVNNLPHVKGNPEGGLLRIPGVTSLSADTHKNGWAPKGSSVLICLPIGDRVFGEVPLNQFSPYSVPNWTGGVYGTPNTAGSQTLVHILHAYSALVTIGKEGYLRIATDIFQSCQALADVIKALPPLEMVCPPEVNVVTFKLDSSWPLGSSYAFAHFMEKEGITLSALKGDMVHYCVTARFACDRTAVARFNAACVAALKKLQEIRQEVEAGRVRLPGDAGLYGQLSAALEPSAKSSVSTAKYIENWLLGLQGIDDAIRGHFIANCNPYRP